MYLASPHETGPLAEHISIDFYVAFELLHTIRSVAPRSDQTDTVGCPGPASYVYDDKGRKKETSVRAVEIQQDRKQRDLERSLEAQKALNDESQRKLAEQQR